MLVALHPTAALAVDVDGGAGVGTTGISVVKSGHQVVPLAPFPIEFANEDELAADKAVVGRAVVVDAEAQFARRAVALVVGPGQVEVEGGVGGAAADVERVDGVFGVEVLVGIAAEPQGDGARKGRSTVGEIVLGWLGDLVFVPTVVGGAKDEGTAVAAGGRIEAGDGGLVGGLENAATNVGVEALGKGGVEAGMVLENVAEWW